MKNRTKVFSALLLIVLALSVSGCSKLFGPSDEEVIKALHDTGLFSGGVEKYTLLAPIVVLNKSYSRTDGAWQVKVKLTYTYSMSGGRETKPTEKIQSFRIFKSKDSTGNTVWKAAAGLRQ